MFQGIFDAFITFVIGTALIAALVVGGICMWIGVGIGERRTAEAISSGRWYLSTTPQVVTNQVYTIVKEAR